MAATVESLKFELIIDDSGFESQISEMTKKAKEFNTELSDMLGASGNSSAASLGKRVSELAELRRQIGETVDSINILQNRMQRIYESGGANGGNLFLMGDTQNKIDALNDKLATLAAREREISGDSSVAAALDDITDSIHEQSIESLQLADALRRQAEESERLAKAEKVQQKADKTAKVNAERKARQELAAQKKRELEIHRKLDAQYPITIAALDKSAKKVNQFRISQENLNFQLDRSSRLMRGVTSLAATYLSVAGFGRLVRSLVEVTGEFEMQRTTLRAILKDIDGADTIFSQIKELAVFSPFTFKELVTYTKQLSAFSVPMGELYDTTKMLADVSAGLGVGMDRLILAYGQIRSAGVLRGQELRQLTEAGVPVLTELKQRFQELGETAITTSDIFDKISTRQVPFEMIADIFSDMTSEGGKFYKMQEVQAETLKGKLSNLTDAYQIMFSEIGEKLNPAMKDFVDWLRSLAENYQDTGRKIANLVTIYGTYRVALAAVKTLQRVNTFELGLNTIMVNAQQAGVAITRLRAAIQALTTAQAANNAVSAANVYAAIAAAVAMVIVGISALIRKLREQDTVTKAMKEANDAYIQTVKNETAELDVLFSRLQRAEKGTSDYEVAKRRILSTYDKYLSDIDRENLLLGNQVEVYKRLTERIRQNAATKAYSEGMNAISDDYLGQQNTIVENLMKSIENNIKDKADYEGVAKQMAQLVRREISVMDLTTTARVYYEKWNNAIKKAGSQYASKTPNVLKAMTDYQGITDDLSAASTQLSSSLGILYGVDLTGPVEQVAEWKKSVEGVLSTYGVIARQLNTDDFSTRESYIDSLIKKYGEANETIRKFGKVENEETKAAKELLPAIEAVLDSFGVSMETWTKAGAGGSGRSSTDPMIQIMSNRIQKLQELEEMYKNISQYLSDSEITKNFGSLFTEGLDFPGLIENALQALEVMGAAGKEKANEIRQQIKFNEGKRTLDEALEFQKRIAEYTKEQRNLEEQIADLEAEKAADLAKLDKGTKAYIATEAHYNAELDKLKEQLLDLKSIQMTGFWTELTGADDNYNFNRLSRLYDQIVELRGFVDRMEAKKNSKGMIIGYTLKKQPDMSKDLAKSLGLDDENGVVTLTIGQFQKLQQAVGDTADKMSATDSIRSYFKLLDSGKADSDDLRKAFIEAAGEADVLVSGIGEIGTALVSIGEESSNYALQGFGKMLEVVSEISDVLLDNETVLGIINREISNSAETISDIMKTSDWITLAVKAVTLLIRGFQRGAEYQAAIQKAAEEYRKTLHEIALENADTVFGTNNVQKYAEAIRNLEETLLALQKVQKQVADGYTFSYHTKTREFFRKLAELRGYSKNEWEKLEAEWSSALNGSYSDNQEFFEWVLANQETIRSSLNYTERSAFDSLIQNIEAYKTALEEVDDMVSSIFGNLGDDIADALINAFIETGDAATDLADNMKDTFNDLGKEIAKSLISSFVIGNMLEKYRSTVDELIGYMSSSSADPDVIAQKFGSLADNISQDADAAAAFTNALLKAMQASGFDFSSEGSTSGLSNGIKSITEDTANLLASYINAIRADVSVTRTMVATILGLLPSAPTLSEYLAEIQANTYNNAVAAQSILERLDSSMAAFPNGGRAFNVNIS